MRNEKLGKVPTSVIMSHDMILNQLYSKNSDSLRAMAFPRLSFNSRSMVLRSDEAEMMRLGI